MRLVEENGAEFSRKLFAAMQTVQDAMHTINKQAKDLHPIAETLKSFGRLSQFSDDEESEDRF